MGKYTLLRCYHKGRLGRSKDEGATLSARVRRHPDDAESRATLLGQLARSKWAKSDGALEMYGPEILAEIVKHYRWFVERRPEDPIHLYGLPAIFAGASRDPNSAEGRACRTVRALWLRQVELKPTSGAVAGRAAEFMRSIFPLEADPYFRMAQRLDRANALWFLDFGHVLLIRAETRRTKPKIKLRWAGRALTQFERALKVIRRHRNPFNGALASMALEYATKAAILCDKRDRARLLATRLVRLSQRHGRDRDDEAWHQGNLALGRLAMRNGDVAEAKLRLIAAARVSPGSPGLSSFGPNMSLAKDLLETGERKIVLTYLRLCREFWRMHRDDELVAWIRQVKVGAIPEFGPNLIY